MRNRRAHIDKVFELKPSAACQRWLSMVLVSTMVLVFSGLDSILAYGFTISQPANDLPSANHDQPLKKNKQTVNIADYSDIVETTGLNCITDLPHVKVVEDVHVDSLFWPHEVGHFFENDLGKELSRERLNSHHNKASRREANRVTVKPKNHLATIAAHPINQLKRPAAIAIIGPAIELGTSSSSCNDSLEELLVSTIPKQIHLPSLNQENKQVSVLASLPNVLVRSINGGLSQARWQAKSNAQGHGVALSSCNQPKQLTNYYLSLAGHDYHTNQDHIYFDRLVCKNVKTPIMSTGPPRLNASYQTSSACTTLSAHPVCYPGGSQLTELSSCYQFTLAACFPSTKPVFKPTITNQNNQRLSFASFSRKDKFNASQLIRITKLTG